MWKSRSWLGGGTKTWGDKTGSQDPNPAPLDNWISDNNTDIN